MEIPRDGRKQTNNNLRGCGTRRTKSVRDVVMGKFSLAENRDVSTQVFKLLRYSVKVQHSLRYAILSFLSKLTNSLQQLVLSWPSVGLAALRTDHQVRADLAPVLTLHPRTTEVGDELRHAETRSRERRRRDRLTVLYFHHYCLLLCPSGCSSACSIAVASWVNITIILFAVVTTQYQQHL